MCGQAIETHAPKGLGMPLEDHTMLARAVERNWRSAWAALGLVDAEPHSVVDDTSAFLRVYTPGVSESLLNLVMSYRSSEPVTPEATLATLGPYLERRLPVQWWLLLGDEPAGLRESLRVIGMESWGGATALALPLETWSPSFHPSAPDLEFLRVATWEEGMAALRVISEVFFVAPEPMRRWTVDNPAFSLYAARWQGRVVAGLTTLQRDGVVGVYNVATLGGARRRGIAGNLVIHALREAAREGARLATLTATPQALRLYSELGFRSVGVIEQWVPGPYLARRLNGALEEQTDRSYA
jgi:GNAT superfamily N-acetyltransferase